jgi:hypothetical protein
VETRGEGHYPYMNGFDIVSWTQDRPVARNDRMPGKNIDVLVFRSTQEVRMNSSLSDNRVAAWKLGFRPELLELVR